MGMYRRRDQLAAAYAFQVVGNRPSEKYRSLVRELPTLLATCRLPATVAFLKAKGGDEHSALHDHLKGWLYGQDEASGVFGLSHPDLIDGIRAIDSRTLRRMERSAVRLATWLKRAAEVNSQ